MAFNAESVALTKSIVLRGILIVYIIAFTSLYVQVQALFGDNGVAPLKDFLAKANTKTRSPFEAYNILTLAPKLSLSYGTFVELLCLVGILIGFSALFVRRCANAFSFGTLWYVYYSINQAGQGFMSFHSDLLLLEVGFIAILLAPLIPSGKRSNADHDHIAMYLLKWLTFRYFVTNVLTLYLENDKVWYDLTAIPMVAQGVQFPSIFSWHVFQHGKDLARMFQGYEHSLKLITPFLCFVDLKYTKQLGFYTLVSIYCERLAKGLKRCPNEPTNPSLSRPIHTQTLISLASALFYNFGWTDLLICILLFSYFKDAHYYNDKRTKQSIPKTLLDILFVIGYLALTAFVLVRFYGYKYSKGVMSSQVMFTAEQFKLLADHLVPVSLVVGSLGLLATLRTTYFTSKRKTSIIKNLIYTLIMVPIFFSTFPTLMRFAPSLEIKVKPLSYTKELSRFTAPYMLSNNYIILSKVSQHYGNGRPELQLQGRASAEEPVWQQFDMRYKPGQPSKEFSRVIPHIPRIDLKLWYAARSSLQNNQWVQTFAYRVATKESDVVNLLAPTGPLPKVSQIRVALYNYKYSSSERRPFAGYWSQSKFVSEYMPATSIENLKFNVKSNGVSLTPTKKGTDDGKKQQSIDQLLSKYLDISSDYIRGIDHTAVIWTSLALAATSVFRSS